MKKIKSYQWRLKDISKFKTISQGQTDDLKVESEGMKVWLSRMTKEDGMPYNNQITVELFNNKLGSWETVEQYEAR
jgi:hypothetical protein